MTPSGRWVVVLAVLACGCSVPALDTTGQIRCGTTQPSCPDAFACVNNECCPVDPGTHLPQSSCGLGVAACDRVVPGAFPGPTSLNGACPPVTSGIGRPCQALRDCVTVPVSTPALVCADRLPGGYCTQGCEPAVPTSCGSNGVCLPSGQLAGERGICVRRCTLPPEQNWARCRADLVNGSLAGAMMGSYVCVTPSGFMYPVCIPDCTVVPMLCATNTHCDATLHYCVGNAP